MSLTLTTLSFVAKDEINILSIIRVLGFDYDLDGKHNLHEYLCYDVHTNY